MEAGFLPPEAPGPEPEIGSRRPAPPPAYAAAPPGYGAWQQAPPQPDNNPAILGFVFSLVGLALLLFTAGLSTVVSLACSVTAVVAGRRGVKRVDAGETPKHRGFAQAGFWIGVAGVVLALLATAIWVIVAVAAATDEQFRDDFEREFDDSRTISLALPALARLAPLLVG